MNFKKHIPNIITLLNLFSGTVAVILAVENELVYAAYFVFLGIFFDFFDGFFARILKVQGELGKQLDSLADMVTSGVVPGVILFQLLKPTNALSLFNTEIVSWKTQSFEVLPYLGLIVTLAAAYRLAKFNIDTRQTSSFIGLPTPAASIVVMSLPLILEFSSIEIVKEIILNKWFLIAITLLLSYLMNAEIPLFALKFKDYSWTNNKIKFVFVGLTALLCIFFQFIAIPLVILLYVILSIIDKK